MLSNRHLIAPLVSKNKSYLYETLGIAKMRGDVVDKAEPFGLVQGLVVEYTDLSKVGSLGNRYL